MASSEGEYNKADTQRIVVSGIRLRKIRPSLSPKTSKSKPPDNKPSIFTKSPEEYARDAQFRPRNNTVSQPSAHQPLSLELPPTGYVRVLYWSSLQRLRRREGRSEMRIDIPLEPDGSLDLSKVKRAWGLESVVVIDAIRWVPFETADPNRLSPVAVQTQSHKRYIHVTEPAVSRKTLSIRKTRLMALDFYSIYRIIFYSAEENQVYYRHVPESLVRWPCFASIVHDLAIIRADADAAYEYLQAKCTAISRQVGRRVVELGTTTDGTQIMHAQTLWRTFVNDWGSLFFIALSFISILMVHFFLRA